MACFESWKQVRNNLVPSTNVAWQGPAALADSKAGGFEGVGLRVSADSQIGFEWIELALDRCHPKVQRHDQAAAQHEPIGRRLAVRVARTAIRHTAGC